MVVVEKQESAICTDIKLHLKYILSDKIKVAKLCKQIVTVRDHLLVKFKISLEKWKNKIGKPDRFRGMEFGE